MVLFQSIVCAICGILDSLGGYHWLFCRRFIMPVVIGVALSVVSHVWWLGFTVLPVMGTLCLGYFGGKFWGRGLWLGLQAAVIGLGSFLLHYLAWYFYAPYVVGAFLLGGFLYNLEQVIGDLIFGCWLAVLVFVV